MTGKGTGGADVRLRQELERLKFADPFLVLGVAPSADAPAIRWAFLELTKRYHPNRFARERQEVRELANEVFLLVRRAYDVLSNEDRRRTWRDRVNSGRTGPSTQTPPIPVPPIPREGERAPRDTARSFATPPSAPRLDMPPIVGSRFRPPTAPSGSPAPVPPQAIPAPVAAQSSEKRRLFEEANKLMEQGRYAEARQVYDRVSRTAAPTGSAPALAAPGLKPPTKPPTKPPAGDAISFRPPPQAPAPSGTPSQGVPRRQSEVDAVLEQARGRTQRFDEATRVFQRGEYPEAREAFQRLAAEDPQNKKYRVYLYYAWGLEHRAAGRIDEALRELERAVFLEPELAEARRDLDKTRELKKAGGGLFSKLFGR